MKVLALLLAFTVATSTVQGHPEIIALQVKTDRGGGASMTFGKVAVEIYDNGTEFCRIDDLDAGGNDFKPDAIDEFVGGDLEDCDGFPLPGGVISRLRLIHHGIDAWTPEWVRVFTDDSITFQCDAGQQIDDSESLTLDCY